MLNVRFTPVNAPQAPVLTVSQHGSRSFSFQGSDTLGRTHFETVHATLADALRQVAIRMDVEDAARTHIQYEVTL